MYIKIFAALCMAVSIIFPSQARDNGATILGYHVENMTFEGCSLHSSISSFNYCFNRKYQYIPMGSAGEYGTSTRYLGEFHGVKSWVDVYENKGAFIYKVEIHPADLGNNKQKAIAVYNKYCNYLSKDKALTDTYKCKTIPRNENIDAKLANKPSYYLANYTQDVPKSEYKQFEKFITDHLDKNIKGLNSAVKLKTAQDALLIYYVNRLFSRQVSLRLKKNNDYYDVRIIYEDKSFAPDGEYD